MSDENSTLKANAAAVQGMTLAEYLGQSEYVIDPKSGTVYRVEDLNPVKRMYAARWLSQHATPLVILLESLIMIQQGDLVGALRMIDQSPRNFIEDTELYGFVHRDDRTPVQTRPSATALSQMRAMVPRQV